MACRASIPTISATRQAGTAGKYDRVKHPLRAQEALSTNEGVCFQFISCD